MEKDALPLIEVEQFREILLWPFRLDIPKRDRTEQISDRINREADRLKASGWEEVTKSRLDALSSLGSPQDGAADAYAEFVYFHPFIQDLLFSDPSPLRLFRLGAGIERMEVSFGTGDPLIFSVERCHLYLLPPMGVAVLALEVSSETLGTLDRALTVLDTLRRAYPPYWISEKEPGLSPDTVRWLGRGDTEIRPSEPLDRDQAINWVRTHHTSPLASHWRALLQPLQFDPQHWRQLGDERMPVMAWLKVKHPEAISRGDWVRLALLDKPDGHALPYGTVYLTDFEARHCYDAFWDPKEGKTTRTLLSGHSFVMVGNDDFFTTHARTHFRRHYFQMGLIAHLQIAALLALSHRLSHASDLSDPAAEDILKAALDFTHRLWFPDLSNHSQSRELFQRWRSFLGTETLYAQVMREAQDHLAFRNARSDRAAADAANTLSLVATVGLTLSLVVGLLGINVLIPGQTGSSVPNAAEPVTRQAVWAFVETTIAGVLGCTGLGLGLIATRRRWREAGWVAAVLGLVAMVAAYLAQRQL